MFNAGHPEDDVLEKYAMSQLSEPAAESLEEHFLVCGSCQDRLDFTETYIRSMKSAMATAEEVAARKRSQFNVADWFRMPLPLWAPLAAVLLIGIGGIVGTQYFGRSASPVAMVLTATRGETASIAASGPLDLKLDARDLAPAANYHVQIVNGQGADIWDQDSAGIQNGFVHILVKKHLSRGQYFVRLFAQDSGTPREYGLEIR